jgi:hypothetical protein
MSTNVKSKFNLSGICSRKVLLFVSLVLMAVLVSSCLFFAFNDASSVLGTSDNVVSNEAELRNAVNAATVSTVIALGNDITLTSSALTIPADKNITLTSNSKNGFYKLIGVDKESTIVIEKRGVLNLEGIVVTHMCDANGSGVFVQSGATFILYSGVICNNIADFFTMPIGTTVREGGGGVCNFGRFEMFGGEISGNTASGGGGGVYNYNGKVSLSDGSIQGNNAGVGGGVYIYFGSFDMSGGVVFGNVAEDKGGGVYNYYAFSKFNLSGGEIFNNTALLGGGVCTDGDFNISSDDMVFGNTANIGSDVYVGNGSSNWSVKSLG